MLLISIFKTHINLTVCDFDRYKEVRPVIAVQ